MQVDWDWAKQRPHFLAEYLGKHHRLTVCYPYSIHRDRLRKNDFSGLRKIPFLVLPYADQSPWMYHINTFTYRIISKVLFFFSKPDLIWLCSPEYLDMLPKGNEIPLVYDCMDNQEAFSMHPLKKEMLIKQERRLVEEAKAIFCSSQNLMAKIVQRYGPGYPLCLVNNAFDPSSLKLSSDTGIDNRLRGNRFKLGYIGTISNWMDQAALAMLVSTFENLEVHLLGPIEIAVPDRIKHDCVFWHGPVPHSDLKYYACDFDAFIMPFLVTELIQSVDPVKFYEYIFFNKPIISVKYPEIERFKDFVDFYTDHGSLQSIVGKYLDNGFNKKYSAEARERFIAENTWERRAAFIEDFLLRRDLKPQYKI